MKVRWGHFSDLHFQFGEKGFDTKNLRKQLLKKLADEVTDNGKLNYIFITGDIFHKGRNDSSSLHPVKEFIHQIADASKCEYKDIIICAGNHDLKRSKARKRNLDSVLEEYNENGGLDYNGFGSIIVQDTCKPFWEACEEINGYPNNKLHYCVSSKEMNIFVLNTSIFSGQTYPNQKNPQKELEDTNLYICDDNLHSLKADETEDKLNIVLAHHGIECFCETERQKLLNYLRNLNIDLYLCGHVHKTIARTLDEANGAQQYSCGGLFVDQYNSPSFIIGEYDTESKKVLLRNIQFVQAVGEWRISNCLSAPYDENGISSWIPKRFAAKERIEILNSRKIQSFDYNAFVGLKKVSTGLDRDKDFIEIRERAQHSVFILGVGMSKLSKYALWGPHSLNQLLERVPIHLLMLDPEYLHKSETVSKMLENFFGINKFSENVNMAFNTLEEFCKKHNSSDRCKNKITLSVYSSVPTMSAVVIDDGNDNAEMVVEYFGYHCGQNRPLFAISRNAEDETNSLFWCINEQIKMLNNEVSRSVVK